MANPIWSLALIIATQRWMDIGCSTFLQERQFWWHNSGQVVWIAEKHLTLIRASPERAGLGWSLFLEIRIVCASGKIHALQGCPFSFPQGERGGGYNLHLWECNAGVCLHYFPLCLHIVCSGYLVIYMGRNACWLITVACHWQVWIS